MILDLRDEYLKGLHAGRRCRGSAQTASGGLFVCVASMLG
jgi:hypothetical protein